MHGFVWFGSEKGGAEVRKGEEEREWLAPQPLPSFERMVQEMRLDPWP